MILIKNKQKKIKVDIKKMHATAEKMLARLGYQDFDLGILLTTNKTIRKFNKKFRGKDKPTDVLSFPFHDYLKPGEKIKPKSIEDKNLGDIIISLEYAQILRQAPAVAKAMAGTQDERDQCKFEKHLVALLAHGIAHLIGYDHITDAQFKQMLKIEQLLLKDI